MVAVENPNYDVLDQFLDICTYFGAPCGDVMALVSVDCSTCVSCSVGGGRFLPCVGFVVCEDQGGVMWFFG